MQLSETTAVWRPLVPAFLALTLAALFPASSVAANQTEVVKCQPTLPAGTDYVTVVLNLEKLEIYDEDDGLGDSTFEFGLTANPMVHLLDGQGRPVGNPFCTELVGFTFDYPVLNIITQGFMGYPLNQSVEVRNVPRNAEIAFRLGIRERDNLDIDWGDLDPAPDNSAILGTWIALRPLTGRGSVHANTVFGHALDLQAGRRKRIVGDGRGEFADFKAGMEFTIHIIDQPEVGGAVITGTAPPKVGGAIPATGTPTVPDPARDKLCRDYAQTAITQFAATTKLTDCSFPPPVWDSNFAHHYSWCMEAQNHLLAPAGTALRDQQLKACGG